MNMNQWLKELLEAPIKKPIPVLSFPGIQKMNITVNDLIESSDYQAECMKVVADSGDTAATVSFMDLSVEAECFGSNIRYSDDEVPTVVGSIVSNKEEAEALEVPEIGSARTGIYIDAIKKSLDLIKDRPILAGVIGPFSLTGRLVDITEVMIYCYDDPEMVHIILEKASEFIKKYILAFKEAGAHGVVMAEPLAGILSPGLAQEFSADYVKNIIEEVEDENFIVLYHNCGNHTVQQVDSIISTGAKMMHFGDAIELEDIIKLIPEDIIVLGNVNPASQFMNGTPESIREETWSLMEKCSKYKNFVISSGCDIPPLSPWENIDAFFNTVNDFYTQN